MKKKVLTVIVAVTALAAIVAGIVIIPQCFAPDFTVEGTYISEEGVKVVIEGEKISCEEIDELNGELKLEKFNTEYARDLFNSEFAKEKGTETELIRFYDLGEGRLFIYVDHNETKFGYGEYMFTLQK